MLSNFWQICYNKLSETIRKDVITLTKFFEDLSTILSLLFSLVGIVFSLLGLVASLAMTVVAVVVTTVGAGFALTVLMVLIALLVGAMS
jgi:hypothetical protein